MKVNCIKYFGRGCGITDAENGYTVDAFSRKINSLGLNLRPKFRLYRGEKAIMIKNNKVRAATVGVVCTLMLTNQLALAVTVDWPAHGKNSSEQRFSELSSINEKNVSNLKVDWFVDMPGAQDGLAATPIVVDGVIYATTSFANVYAIDGATGKIKWHFNPETNPGNGFSNSWSSRVNRGVAVSGSRVFVATPDCRLIALDIKDGKKIWDELTCDPKAEYSITGAPRVAAGKVFIGNGISDYGARGYLSAYDVSSGKLVWRFWTVPGDPKKGYENETVAMAAKTWADGWAKSGGGSPWDAIVYDEELNQVYFGTDSAIPYDPEQRSPGGGDNLFTNSIVAVDADTGKYKWHYQTVPNDAWDYNSASHIILADLKIGNGLRKVLMQAPKNGFFYVLDRKSGKLIKADPYVGVNWAKKIDLETGRPIENPDARYYKNKSKSAELVPSLIGGHNWHPMSFSQKTGLVYIPAHEFKTTYRVNPESGLGGAVFDWYGADLNADRTDLKIEKKGQIGRLIAWDPVAGKVRWTVNHELPMNGGVLSTAGNLVFQGTATGIFNAYAADTGRSLWSYNVQSSVQAPPVTYQIGEKQYILASAGGGGIARFMVPLYGTGEKAIGPDRLIAFSLEATKTLPNVVEMENRIPKPPSRVGNNALVEKGRELFEISACGLCHGSQAIGRRPEGASVRDLRYMTKDTHRNFEKIVLEGEYKALGMMPHKDIISKNDAKAIHAYLIDLQWKFYKEQMLHKKAK